MALIRCEYFSDVLGLSTSATIILPQESSRQIGVASAESQGTFPVLYLLHGMSDNDAAWTRWTSIERYVAGLGLAVVMPNAHRSYYTNQVIGYDYWTHISEEVPAIMGSFFPLSGDPANTFVAGLSMGGYGAIKWALRKPDSIAAAASLSGGLGVTSRAETAEWQATFGSRGRARNEGDDLDTLVRAIDPQKCPALYQWCGLDDQNFSENELFRAGCEESGLPLTSVTSTGGHDWARWDSQIRDVLDWLPISPRR